VSLELLEDLEGDGKAKKEGPSFVIFLIVCLVITLVAGGAGFGVSATMLKPVTMTEAPAEEQADKAEEPDPHAPAEDAHGAEAEHPVADENAPSGGLPANLTVTDIAPITTNLLDPSETWIRMELSLAFEGESDQAVAEEIHQDILAYVHTLKLYNLRGGSGFQHLMEDLNERAAIRSDGRVKRVLVRSFILE